MIVNGMRVSRERMAGDPLNLGKLFKKGLKGLGKLALGAGKAYLGVGPSLASADSYTKSLDKYGTPANPATIVIGGTRVKPRTDPLGIGRRLGIHPLGELPAHRRHRRMRVTNVRALRRAFRRVEGFGRLARRYIRVQHRFKPHAFRRRRRR
jgi:hypothetical protein